MKQDRGDSVPALDKKPGLWPWLELYWEAFWFLSKRERRYISSGMSRALPLNLGIGAFLLYFQLYPRLYSPHNEEERQDFIFYLSKMDEVYLEHALKKIKDAEKKP